MKIWIVAYLTVTCLLSGCSVFRSTAVDRHVAVSRDLTLQGLAANSNQNDPQAEHYFSQAVNSDPDNVEARMLLAESYRKRGQIDPAIEQLEAAMKIAPSNTELICQLGECYSVSKQEKYAYRLAQLALRKNKNSVQAWTLKAQTLWRMGLKEPALADYQRALRIDPENNELRRQMSVLYLELDKPLRALTTLDKMSEDYDDAEIPEEILLHQSVALQRMDRNTEAVDRLKIGFERGDYSESFASSYIAALIQENDLSRANQAMQMAVNRFPQASGLAELNTQLNNQWQARVADTQRNTTR